MTQAKHTPGPWKYVETDEGYHIEGDEYKEHCPLATFVMGDNPLANARLIAAAPDLLEACKDALPLLKHLNKFLKYQSVGHEFYPNREGGDDAIDRLHEAISKAEAKQ